MIAEILAGSWRSQPPPLHVSSEAFARALPLLVRTKSAPLGWWSIHDTEYAARPGVDALRDAYRFAALEAQRQETRLCRVVDALRANGIEPILMKGWNLARLYPNTALRRYEDIDLIVPSESIGRARAVLDAAPTDDAFVDFIHPEIDRLDGSGWGALFAGSAIVDLAGTGIRVPAAEDHLRAICIHGLKHGFSDPLWLCDIAASVERAGDDFDWGRCFGQALPQSQWIGCALALARDLIGCDLPHEAERRVTTVPRWLATVVLDRWTTWATLGPPPGGVAKRQFLRDPARLGSILAERWPNHLEVALQRGSMLIDEPRWKQTLWQLGHLFAKDRVTAALLRD